MATHSSVLAWRIPGTGEPGGLPSMGLHRVGHDRSDLAAAAYSSIAIGNIYSKLYIIKALQRTALKYVIHKISTFVQAAQFPGKGK